MPGFGDSSTVQESQHLPHFAITSMYCSVSVSENCSQNTIAISSPWESQDPEIQLTSYITHLTAIVSHAARGRGFFKGAIGVLFGNRLLDKEMIRLIEEKAR